MSLPSLKSMLNSGCNRALKSGLAACASCGVIPRLSNNYPSARERRCLSAAVTTSYSRPPRNFRGLHTTPAYYRSKPRRLTDSEKMEINVKRIPGYDKIVQSLGGCLEDPVRPEVLESFVDANLNDLNSASMTAILNYCGEAGVTFLPLAQRISNYAEKSGIKHFVFDLSIFLHCSYYVHVEVRQAH